MSPDYIIKKLIYSLELISNVKKTVICLWLLRIGSLQLLKFHFVFEDYRLNNIKYIIYRYFVFNLQLLFFFIITLNNCLFEISFDFLKQFYAFKKCLFYQPYQIQQKLGNTLQLLYLTKVSKS